MTFLCGNIPQSPSDGIYISQLIRYARASTLYDDILSRRCRLPSKLMKQGYGWFKFILLLRNFMEDIRSSSIDIKFLLHTSYLTCLISDLMSSRKIYLYNAYIYTYFLLFLEALYRS